MARTDDTKLKIEELDNLKAHLRGFQGQRLAALKGKAAGDDPEAADAGDEADAVAAGHASHSAEGGDTDGHSGTVERDGAGGEDFGEGGNDAAPDEDCASCGETFEAGAGECPHCGHLAVQEGGGEGDESDASDVGGDVDDRARLQRIARR